MKTKATYRIRNWAEYDTSLRRRGSLTFWVSQELLDNWTTTEKTGGRGASPTYTDAAIETLAAVKYLFRQASRQAEGLLASIFELMRMPGRSRARTCSILAGSSNCRVRAARKR